MNTTWLANLRHDRSAANAFIFTIPFGIAIKFRRSALKMTSVARSLHCLVRLPIPVAIDNYGTCLFVSEKSPLAFMNGVLPCFDQICYPCEV